MQASDKTPEYWYVIVNVAVPLFVLGMGLAVVVYRDATKIGADAFLFGVLTILLGPIGLGVYFAMRGGLAQKAEERRMAEAAAGQALLATLPTGGGVQIPEGPGLNFSSFSAAEEATFRPFEARMKGLQRQSFLSAAIPAGAVFVTAIILYASVWPYAASGGSQPSFPSSMTSGDTAKVTLSFRNDGTQDWNGTGPILSTIDPAKDIEAPSAFQNGSWATPSRIGTVDLATNVKACPPGSVCSFTATLAAPEVDSPTSYSGTLRLMNGFDPFGPMVNFTINVNPRPPAPPPPASVPASAPAAPAPVPAVAPHR